MSGLLVRHEKAKQTIRRYERRESSLLTALLLIATTLDDESETAESRENVAKFARAVVARCKAGEYDTNVQRVS